MITACQAEFVEEIPNALGKTSMEILALDEYAALQDTVLQQLP